MLLEDSLYDSTVEHRMLDIDFELELSSRPVVVKWHPLQLRNQLFLIACLVLLSNLQMQTVDCSAFETDLEKLVKVAPELIHLDSLLKFDSPADQPGQFLLHYCFGSLGTPCKVPEDTIHLI